MRKRMFFGLSCIVFLGGVCHAQAPGSRAQEWAVWQKVINAHGKLTFSGTRVVEVKSGSDRRRHTEYVLCQGAKLRIEFSEDSVFANQIIVEKQGKRWHYRPDANEIHEGLSKQDELHGKFLRLKQLVKKGHRLEVAPGTNVAGIATTRMAHKDQAGNLIALLWVDSSTGLVLKKEQFDAVGARTGYFEFTSVNYKPQIVPGDFEIRRQGAKVITVADQLNRTAGKLGVPTWHLPEATGFKLESARIVQWGGRRVLAQVYRGRRARISLFITKGSIDEPGPRKQAGPLVRVARKNVGTIAIFLVGAFPQAELDELLNQVVK